MTTRSDKPAPPRRDATGHLNPQYAADLHAISAESAGTEEGADFLEVSKVEPLSELLAESFVQRVTSGDDGVLDPLDSEEPVDPNVDQ